MEASTSSALTPLLHAADAWQEVALLLPVLIGLEIVLSADNAIALAAIARKQPDPAAQQRALNLGLVFALLFRVVLILAAQWVLNFRPLMGAGAVYLLWLCLSHFFLQSANEAEGAAETAPTPTEAAAAAFETAATSLAGTAFTIALTDLAFSLDSVAAAVAVSDRIGLVITGGVVGVLALRLSSGLFIRLLQRYRRLEAAGYLAVGLVGIQLSVRVFRPDLELPEWALLVLVGLLFAWGFSAQQPETEEV